MGIKTYNPYTPSRRNMTSSDFSEITRRNMLDETIRVRLLSDTVAVETDVNIELLILREIKMV